MVQDHLIPLSSFPRPFQRVINQDQVAPGEGFPAHPHRDMEIFSYVLEGELAHEDSMGNKRTLHPGEVQLMSAGSGLTRIFRKKSIVDMLNC